MRILISCTAAYGHFHPLVPFALAAIARGHSVAFATAEDLVERVRAAGFEGLQVGLPFRDHQLRLAAEITEGLKLPHANRRAYLFPRVNALRARTNLDDLLRVAERWGPDLIVHESAEFSGALVAARVGVPNVNHAYGPRVPESILQDCGNRLADLWQPICAEPVPCGGLYRYLHIDICPASLQVDPTGPPCPAHTIRPMVFNAVAGDQAPAWLDDLPSGPTVHVTFGTRLVQPALLRLTLEALLELDMNVVCTTGADETVAATLPRHARLHVERYIPHSVVLPHCDLVVCHAGAGTMLAALSHGLPMLLLPQSADQFDNAERCVAQGVALQVLPTELEGSAIKMAAAKLLEYHYAQAADDMCEQLLALPPPETAVERCEALVRCRLPDLIP